MPQPLDYESPKPPEKPEAKNFIVFGVLVFLTTIFIPAFRAAMPLWLDQFYIKVIFFAEGVYLIAFGFLLMNFLRKRTRASFYALFCTGPFVLFGLWFSTTEFIEILRVTGIL